MRRPRAPYLILGGGAVGRLVAARLGQGTVLERQREDEYQLMYDRGAHYLWDNIPLVRSEKLRVLTYVDTRYPTPSSVTAYKRKIGKLSDVATRRELDALLETQFLAERYGYRAVAWPKVAIEHGQEVLSINTGKRVVVTMDQQHGYLTTWPYHTLVSTLPLPVLLGALGMSTEAAVLKFSPVHAESSELKPSARYGESVLRMNYVADPATPIYRMTLHGSRMLTESLKPLEGYKRIWPGKIASDADSKALVERLWITHEIRMFGRFGAWQPDELLHESWERIDEWVTAGAT